MNTLYLNNSGSRWITTYTCKEFGIGKKEQREWLTKSGKRVVRTVLFWESFGNFAVACISYKGKKIKVFTDTMLED